MHRAISSYVRGSIRRRLFCTLAQAGPEGESTRDGAPIFIGRTNKAGRGLFATRDLAAAHLIHSVDPILAHPSLEALEKVCYFCLRHGSGERPLKPFSELLGLVDRTVKHVGTHEGRSMDEVATFCSKECAMAAKGFFSVERRANWSNLLDLCREHQLKFPLMGRRLACMVVSKEVSPDVLNMLCYARLPQGIPQSWQHESQLLRGALSAAGFSEAVSFLTDEWYAGIVSRLHLNCFRVEPLHATDQSLEEAAAASIMRDGGVGSAVYLLPSLYNHECEPNVNVTWVDNATAHFQTVCPVKAGEELRICYMDASWSHDARKQFLFESYGFLCECSRCLRGDDL